MTAKAELRRFRNPLHSLYNWVIGWSQSRYGTGALFVLSFVEASFFPIPPDVLLIALCVGRPNRSYFYAAVCLVGSVLGGIFGFFIGMELWPVIGQWFFAYIPGFTPQVFERVASLYRDNAGWAVFTAGFTPIPYKVFTISAGIASISFAVFIVASIASRGLRFFLVAGLIRAFGAGVDRFIRSYFDILSIAFTVLLVGGFLILKKFF